MESIRVHLNGRRLGAIGATLALMATALVSVTLAGGGTASAARTPGELLRYDFAEGSGTVVGDNGSGAPMDLTIANPGNVTWESGGGLTIDANTKISSGGPATKLISAVKASGAFTLEAWVTPAAGTQSGPARIASNSNNAFSRNFLLGQGAYSNLPNDVFSLRSRTSASSGGTPELFTPAGDAVPEQLTHVVASRDASGERTIYVDGVAVNSDTLGGGVGNWDNGFPFTLGNVDAGNRPWLGTFCQFAVYDTALSAGQVGDNYDAGCGGPVEPNVDPTIDDVADQANDEGDAVSLQVSGADIDGDALTYSAQNLATGLSINASTGLITGTIGQTAAADSPYAVTVSVNDGRGGSASDTFSWTVGAVNVDPAVTSPGDQNSSEGQNVSLGIQATDDDDDALTFSANGLPGGLSIDTNSGLISGTVDAGAAASSPYAVEVTVDDGNSGSDSVSFSWNVGIVTGPAPLVNYNFNEGSGNTVADTGTGTPLDLTIQNPGNVTWNPAGGLTIDSTTSILSSGSAKIDNAVTTSGEFTIEAWITPSNANQSGPARVIENGPTPNARNFMLGQGAFSNKPNDVFSVRTRTTAKVAGTPELFSDTGVTSTELTHVVASRDADGNREIYVDGVLSSSDTFGGNASNWDGGYPLVLGNTGNGTRGWLGSFCRVSFYDQALTAGEVSSNFDDGCGESATPNQDPVLDAIADQTNDEGDTPLVQVNASDPDASDDLSYSAAGLPAGLSINGGSGLISGTIGQTAASGSVYSVTVTVSDGNGGTDSEPFDWTVDAVNVDPVLEPIGDQASEAGDVVNLALTAGDDDGDTPTFSDDGGLPTGLSLDPSGLISGTVDAAIANGTVFTTTITVDDGEGGSDSETFDWTIAANSAPVFDTPVPGDQTDDEGAAVSVSFAATDPDGDPIAYSAIDLPTGLSIDPDTGEVSGTIEQTAAANSPYAVTITVDDNRDGSTQTNLTWIVDEVNLDPELDAIGDQNNNEGDAVSIDVDANDVDGDDVTFAATNLPPSLTIDENTGEISGTIDAGAETNSPYTVEITADDGQGGSDTETISWTVSTFTGPDALVRYEFSEGSGATVSDTGTGTPLDLTIDDPSNVTWIPGGGLSIDDITTIASTESSKIADAVDASDEFTVEAWVRSGLDDQEGPARLVSNAPDPFDRNFMLGQGAFGSNPNDVYAFRTRTQSSSSGTPGLFTTTGNAPLGQLVHVVASRDADGNRTVYVDGVEDSSDSFTGGLANWDPTYPLALGNVATGDRGWIGTFCEVAVYDVALSPAEVAANNDAGCDLAAAPAEALVEVTPGGAIGATTFGNQTISVTNTGGANAPTIAKVEFDVRGSLIPDATLDPVGTAGDEGTQCLEVSNEGGTGYVVPGDNCTDPFSLPHEDEPGVAGNGNDGMSLDFTDFDTGEAIVFGVDVDPTTIQGVPGSGGAGAVSGLELSGSLVTVSFSDGQVLTNELFGDGSAGGSQAVVAATKGLVAPTGIELVGVNATPTVFPNDSKVAVVDDLGPQVVQVSGPVGAEVTLLDGDGILESPAPFDPDPYESDTLVAVDYLTGTIGAGGTVDFAVSIDNAAVLHHFVATIDDGANGPLSEKLIVAIDTPAGALVQVTPNGGIGASTFSDGTMSITNTAEAGGADIESVRFDLDGSIVPDATFDPNGTAGDTTPKCLTIASGGAATGFVAPTDPCNEPFSEPHEDEPGVAGNGYDVMTMDFTDFAPGETITFAVDIDPTSIQGVDGSGGAGSVSGLELTGSPITVTFADGGAQDIAVNQLFGDGSAGGATALVKSTTAALAPPAIEVLGVTTTPTVFPNDSEVGSVPATGAQSVRVFGDQGDAVTLLQMTGDLVTDPAFDVDDFESDAAVAVDYFSDTVGADGYVDFAVDIADPDVLYHYTAIFGDGSDGTSTQLLIGVDLNVNAPVLDPVQNVIVSAGDVVAVPISATAPDGEPIELSISSTPDIETSGASFTDNGDGTGSIDWVTDLADLGSYDVTVTATTASGTDEAVFQIAVNDPQSAVLYRVNAGGPEVADPNGGAAWTEDQPTAGAGGTASTGTPSPYLVASSNEAFGVSGAIDLTHPSVPAGTPESLFQLERYDSGAATEMVYEFPVGAGQAYELDLYFAETFATAADVREFTVNVEGQDFLVDYDVYELVGGFAGIVETIITPTVADDFLTVTFSHGIQNPKINAIEVRASGPPPTDVPPLIDAIADTSVVVGGSLTVPIATSEPDGDPITLDFSANPDPASFTTFVDNGDGTGTLTFDPVAGASGSYTFVVSATDKDGTDTEPFNLLVFEPTADVYARINAGGPAVSANDGGPDWEADQGTAGHPFLTDPGSGDTNGFSAVEPGPTVPSSVPGALFDTERWSDAGFTYGVPAPAGTQVFVRLFVGNGFEGTSAAGQRVYDISIDGNLVEDDLDLIPTFGNETGGMLEYLVTSDGSVDIAFSNVVENPLLNGLEVVTAASSPSTLGATPTDIDFGVTLTGGNATDTVTLSNLGFEVGDPAIDVTDVAVAGGEFTTDFAGPVSLAAGATDSFNVSFNPTADGEQTGTLTITHSGDNSPLVINLAGDASNDIPVSFDQTGLTGESSTNPTSLDFGPDGRLYVAQQDATIKAYTVVRNGADDYSVTDTETIDVVKTQTTNHNDDGAANGSNQRQMTGLLVTGTAQTPVIYATSSDHRIAVGSDTGLDTNSGVVSRLTKNGSSWDKVDIVRGLPRSEENHSTNGLDVDEATNTLYVMQGGHANKGAPGNNFSGTPEYYLSAALLSVDLDAIDALGTFTDARDGAEVAYDLRTLNDPSRADIDNSDPDFPYPSGHPLFDSTIDVGDPFGGNNALNQAIPEPNGPVQIYSPGYRNAFDVVFTSQGRLYTSDNGPNGGWGGVPVTYDSNDNPIATGSGPYTLNPGDYCTNEFNESDSNGHGDPLLFISGPGFYGGHPAPIRAFPKQSRVISYQEQGNGNWVDVGNYDFEDLLPADLSLNDFPDNPVECEYTVNDPAKYLDIIGASTNGITEYTATNFGGKLEGNLLTASFNGNIYSYDLNAAGDSVDQKTSLFSGFGSQPLDVIAQGDDDPFPGTVWAATYGADNITVFEPSDSSSCTGAYDPALDEDNDGFDNADEIDAGTNPCSAGDQPTDNDGDGTSDFNDPDDDNDGVDDVVDEFAVDPDNGLTTSIPVLRPFENNDPGTFLFGLGLTGLMTNGTTTYLDQFDPTDLAAGGNGGELGVENIPPGDAFQAVNTQQNAFQYGVDADTSTNPFVVTTEVGAPIFGGNTPANFQSMGLQIGAGDQDNYLKVVVNANGGAGGVEVLTEIAGTAASAQYADAEIGSDVLSAAAGVTLSAIVDPAALTVQPRVQVDGGPIVDLGTPVAIPAAWLDPADENGFAVGVISTSNNATPFDALWAYLDVEFLAGANESPTVASIADAPLAEGETLSVQVDATDADGDPLTYALSGDVPAAMSIDDSGLITWDTDLDDSGSYDVTAEVDDGTNPAVTETFSVAVSQTDSGTVLRRINAGGPAVTATDGGPDWTANPNANTLSELVAGGGNVFGPGTNHSPITDISDPSVPTGTPVEVFNTERWDPPAAPEMAWNFPVAEGATIEVRIGQGEIYGLAGARDYDLEIDGVTVETGITPNALGFGAGFVTDYVVTADADGLDIVFIHGADNPNPKSFEIIELDAAPNGDPTIDSITPSDTVAVTQGQAIPTVTVSASDPDGDIPSLSTDGAEPTGITFSDNGDGTGEFSGTTNVAAGQYPVVVTATDDEAATTSTTVTFDVSDTPNDPPAFDAALGDETIAEIDVYSKTVAASDPDGDTITYSLSGDVPNGMTIDAAGVIDWTPDLAASGVYDITVELSDGVNPVVSDSYTLTVNQTAPDGAAIHRVNAGGPTLPAADGSFPDWSSDTGGPGTTNASPYYVGGGNGVYAPGGLPAPDLSHPTVPGTAPAAVYQTERYGDMVYAFPVTDGTEVEVRIHLNETFQTDPGGRSFDIAINGNTVATDVDPITIGGAQHAASVLDYIVTSDGVVDIEFSTNLDNGSVKGIEILGVSGVPAIDFVDSLDGQTITSDSVTVEWMFNGFNDPTNDHAHFTLDGGPALNPPNDATENPGGTHNTIYRPVTSIDLEGLVDGEHTVTVAVADTSHAEYTNPEAFASATFTVETAPAGPTHARINAGGDLIAATDAGPDWEADGAGAGNHPYLAEPGSDNVGGFEVGGRDASVPANAPQDLFQTERYDNTAGAPNMTYSIPVSTPGATADVNLFMANGWPGSSAPGQRVFDVEIEGVPEIDDLDLSDTYGHQVGAMESFSVVDADNSGTIDIVFLHGPIENPVVNAIEVIEATP